jgi:hypothetical protein
MAYLELFLNAARPSFSRLPITPGLAGSGRHWRLSWEAPDRALVLPGERLCVFTAERGGEERGFFAPVPGRLRHAREGGRFLPAEEVVGELFFGAALETEFAGEAAIPAAAEAARQAETAALQADVGQVASELAALRAELAALQQGEAGNAASPPDTSGLPAVLKSLTIALQEGGEALCARLSPRTRLALLELLYGLRLAGGGPARSHLSPDQELIAAIATVSRLYAAEIRQAEREPADFPAALRMEKVTIWQALRDLHIDQLWREGLRRPAVAEQGGEG